MQYLKDREGLPMFTKRDGAMVTLEQPENVLTHCIEILNAVPTTRLQEGIKAKLSTLMERWKGWEVEQDEWRG